MTRCSWIPKGCSRPKTGTVLVSMLAVMAALTIIFLVALTIAVGVYTRHVKAVNRMTASFLADSGIQRCRLSSPPIPKCDTANCWQTPNGGMVCTRMLPWGPVLLAFSEGTYANQQVTTAAVLGATPPAVFKAAIVVSDPEYPLVVSGTTTITGDVITGPLGITSGRFQGQDIVNEHYHTGNVIALQRPPAPKTDTAVLHQYIRDMQTRRAQCRKRLPASVTFRASEAGLWQEGRSVLVENNAFLDGLQFDRRDSTYSLFADGRVEIGGHTQVLGTIEIISRTTIVLKDSAVVDQALLYADDSIVIGGAVRFSGIAISPHRIVIRDRARLEFPAMLVVDAPSDSCADSCGIFLRTVAPVEASCIVLIEEHSTRIPEPQILIDTNVTISGVLVSQCVVDLRGTLLGSVWTTLFRFYAPPTTYVNWLRNAHVDRPRLTFVPALPILPGDTVASNLHVVWQEEAKP